MVAARWVAIVVVNPEWLVVADTDVVRLNVPPNVQLNVQAKNRPNVPDVPDVGKRRPRRSSAHAGIGGKVAINEAHSDPSR